jgi:pimeloyl-ACP methyl ester carboxylesterase
MRTDPLELTTALPDARLRYVTRGSGPVLLLIAGGHGDASKSEPLAAHLADAYTVITYDRRGLSGSTTDAPARSLAAHAEDASHLLRAITDEPAYVYGTSIGGLIALALASRHPDQVRVVVAHEPGAVSLLAGAERAAAIEDLLAVEEAFASDGVEAALRKFAEFADIDPTDREPDVQLRPQSPQELANMEFLVRYDLPALRRHVLELSDLRDSGVVVVPAVGASSGHIWPHRCGRLLAERLDLPPDLHDETFPGGHLGYVFRPRETAERLREVLNDPRWLRGGRATPRRTRVGRLG